MMNLQNYNNFQQIVLLIKRYTILKIKKYLIDINNIIYKAYENHSYIKQNPDKILKYNDTINNLMTYIEYYINNL